MKIMKYLFLFTTIIFVSCDFDIFDIDSHGHFSEKISSNYVYWSYGVDNKSIKSEYVSFNNNILPKVTEFKVNEKYIIVEQKPNYKLIKSEFRQLFRDSIPNRDDFTMAELKADSFLKSDSNVKKIINSKLNYYIITFKQKKINGPFTFFEFNQKRKELGITNLKFDFEK